MTKTRDFQKIFLYTIYMKRFSVHSEIGSLGEKLAQRYLEKRGHTVLAKNYYYEKGKRSGEIDIITEFQEVIHFIEVKTRAIASADQKSQALYFPIEAQVTPSKIQKMLKTATHYLLSTRKTGREYHFDLITVLYTSEEKKAEIQYLQDIFY